MGKVSKDISKSGKHTFEGPKVKERKHFAPATKVEKPKKGKGSYNRKKSHDEDEEQEIKVRNGRTEGDKKGLEDLRKRNKGKGVSFDPKSTNNSPKIKNFDPKVIEDLDEDEEGKACWKGYKKQGTKKKGGKTVNNCVKESIENFVACLIDRDHAKAHDHLKKAIQEKLRSRMEKEINTPLFTK